MITAAELGEILAQHEYAEAELEQFIHECGQHAADVEGYLKARPKTTARSKELLREITQGTDHKYPLRNVRRFMEEVGGLLAVLGRIEVVKGGEDDEKFERLLEVIREAAARD